MANLINTINSKLTSGMTVDEAKDLLAQVNAEIDDLDEYIENSPVIAYMDAIEYEECRAVKERNELYDLKEIVEKRYGLGERNARVTYPTKEPAYEPADELEKFSNSFNAAIPGSLDLIKEAKRWFGEDRLSEMPDNELKRLASLCGYSKYKPADFRPAPRAKSAMELAFERAMAKKTA